VPGRLVGRDHYGASGKAPDLFNKFGLTADNVQHEINESITGDAQ
jgi:transketolase